MTTKHWRMAEKDKVTKRRLGERTVIQPNHPRITKLTMKTLTRREAPVSWSLENHAAKKSSCVCNLQNILYNSTLNKRHSPCAFKPTSKSSKVHLSTDCISPLCRLGILITFFPEGSLSL